MNRLLIVGILVISTMPLFALAARPDLAKLKAEAQNVVSIIKGDKAKTDVYCQINDLGEQIDGADQKKAEALSQQVIELEKKLGPEYSVLVNDLKNVDPNSPEGRDVDSILAPLDDPVINADHTGRLPSCAAVATRNAGRTSSARVGRMTATWRYSPWRGRGRALAGCTPAAATLACTTKLPAHRPAAFVRLIHN